jgi:hypothetical protein
VHKVSGLGILPMTGFDQISVAWPTAEPVAALAAPANIIS